MKTSPQIVQVHRFGEYLAIKLGADTKYISHSDAQQLVKALNAVITDIAERSFIESKVGTFRTTFVMKG